MNRSSPDSHAYDQFLDAQGDACPLPLLKVKRCLNQMAAGECLKVEATDPGSKRDFRVFAELAGHELTEAHVSEALFVYYFVKR